MNIVAFEDSLRIAERLLKEINLFGQKGIKSINKDGVSDEFRHASYTDDYFNVYKIGLANFDYDFRLFDNSFFQFSLEEPKGNAVGDARYAFFQNPQDFIDYEEYLDILRQDGLIEDENNEDLGYMFIEEYQQYLIEQRLNLASTSIRYDVDPSAYRPLIHSSTHIHIGHSNHIRIPCARFLSPMKFVFFVLKHVYYYHWKDLIEKSDEKLMDIFRKEKDGCPILKSPYWEKVEEIELFLI